MTTDAERLVSITVDGSTHTRTAQQWIDLSRVDLAPSPNAPIEPSTQADCKDRLMEALADAAQNATLPKGYQWGKDAMEQFTVGKNRAYLAVRKAFYDFFSAEPSTQAMRADKDRDRAADSVAPPVVGGLEETLIQMYEDMTQDRMPREIDWPGTILAAAQRIREQSDVIAQLKHDLAREMHLYAQEAAKAEAAEARVKCAEAIESRVKIADEMVKLFLDEAERCPMLPIDDRTSTDEQAQWTDWITMVLKNCGAWKP